MDSEQTPAAQAEVQVVGSALLSARALEEIFEVMSPKDCADMRHELILDAALAVYRKGVPVDAVTVGDRMGFDSLNRVGGSAYLAYLSGQVVTAASARTHAEIVLDASRRRRASAQMAWALHQLERGEGELLDIANVIGTELEALTSSGPTEVTNTQAVYEAIAALDEPAGLSTPWSALTSAIAGWRKGNLYIFGARPSVGKSNLGTNILLDVAHRGKTAMVFSLEMTSTDLYHRMLSAVGGVDMYSIQHRSLTERQHQMMAEAARRISELPLVVNDGGDMSVPQMKAAVRAQQRRGEVGIVVIDYLQLVRATKASGDRRVDVDGIARDIQIAAKELDVPVVALAQLNRAGAHRGVDSRPTLTDLRESGALEQAADVVGLLHRAVGDPAGEGTLGVALAKNRHGPTTTFELTFQGWLARIVDPDVARHQMRSVS